MSLSNSHDNNLIAGLSRLISVIDLARLHLTTGINQLLKPLNPPGEGRHTPQMNDGIGRGRDVKSADLGIVAIWLLNLQHHPPLHLPHLNPDDGGDDLIPRHSHLPIKRLQLLLHLKHFPQDRIKLLKVEALARPVVLLAVPGDLVN